MTNIKVATDELHNAFNRLNETFFNGELPAPAITIQTSGKRKAMGWCTTKEVWGDREGKIKLYEINIAAEFLDLDFFETMDTLMHEMVHLYNIIHDVRDCSRGGTYHNKKFKAEAEKRGFYFENDKPDKRYGWYNPKLKEETKEKILTLEIDKKAFVIARRGEELHRSAEGEESEAAQQEEQERKKSYRWVCPGCGLIVRSSKPDISIQCMSCEKQLEERDK
ncbi:SprT-like domain-containing protein [Bacillus subtilis]|uniref:SprT-like domain-containing protein n=1 Tax=Bacillus subtilis TaxID=1423 RepID=UPI0021B12E7A|nr:SprT-like domain-containing protein [Bacillus subtilis]MCT6515646.1 SprT-like domain-containing protein [Bacillus subtilis]HEO2443878.1 SprT-like domain-containing protein [Streptococcus agalactiae]